jgi:hypothetical protein
VKNELGSFASEEDAFSSLAQAWRRIVQFEKTTKLEVPRVMTAPFGVCAEGTMPVLARLGFESAFISHGSLHNRNPDCSWTPSLGLMIATIIGGFPVMPRFRFNNSGKNTILLAAYLGQPIIPLGHDQDMAGDLAVLADLAQFTNSLGQVQWCDVSSISRSNFLVRQDGDLLRVRPYSQRFQVDLPAGMTGISVEPPEGAFPGVNLKINASSRSKPIFSGPPGGAVAVPAGSVLDITLERGDMIDPDSIPDRGLSLFAFARRQLTEGRDRLKPWLHRLARNPSR